MQRRTCEDCSRRACLSSVDQGVSVKKSHQRMFLSVLNLASGTTTLTPFPSTTSHRPPSRLDVIWTRPPFSIAKQPGLCNLEREVLFGRQKKALEQVDNFKRQLNTV